MSFAMIVGRVHYLEGMQIIQHKDIAEDLQHEIHWSDVIVMNDDPVRWLEGGFFLLYLTDFGEGEAHEMNYTGIEYTWILN